MNNIRIKLFGIRAGCRDLPPPPRGSPTNFLSFPEHGKATTGDLSRPHGFPSTIPESNWEILGGNSVKRVKLKSFGGSWGVIKSYNLILLVRNICLGAAKQDEIVFYALPET